MPVASSRSLSKTTRLSRSIYAAVAILLMTLGLGFYVDAKNDAMHGHHLEIVTRLERMVRLKQELTSMLIISVLERNTLRSTTYGSVNVSLEETIQTVSELTRELRLSGEISALGEGQAMLRTFESRAIELMRSDRWEEARKVLFDDDYVLAKKIYEINSETAISALTDELATQARQFEKLRMVALALRMGALLLLLWVGVMFSRRLRRELDEQTRLHEAIQAANELLEDKVQQRTAELEAANRQLEALSATDALTGLGNRRKFDEVWRIECHRAARHGLPVALAMIDVDFFKAYNDHYGHQAGDDCLQRIARVLGAEARRAGELAARYGGEEFVLLIPGTALGGACLAAERVRAAVQLQEIPHASSAIAPVVTVSIGVACGIPDSGEGWGRLLQEADQALYEAKRLGRNRVYPCE